MNPEHLISLKEAAELIKMGKTKPARGLIIQVLRDDPENSQAWYMLSFAVPKVDKQIYALQQTIRLVPDHQKAIDRILKLGGELPQSSTEREIVSPFLSTDERLSTASPKEAVESQETDLLAQRLFGEKPVAKEIVETEPEVVKTPVFYDEIAEQREAELASTVEEEIQTESTIVPIPKIFGIPRKIFLIGIGILVLGMAAIMVYSPQIIQWIENSSPAQQSAIHTLESQPKPTETPLPQNTPTNIPPTLTPSPTATPIILNLFSTSDLFPPSEENLLLFESIQTGVQSVLNYSADSSPSIYTISDARLQTFLWDFAKLEGFETQVKDNQKILEILGLSDPGDDFSSFYQNLWVDPNGTLFLPDAEMIAIVGLDFSEYQKYSFAQAYVQYLRNQQFPDVTSQIYPPCLELSEQCEIGLALYKGEAAFTAWQWASQTYEEEPLNTLRQTTKKLFYNPVISPPSVMEAIRIFPYDDGLAFVEYIQEQEGWEGIENLYTELPATTEQILHPEKYLLGEIGADIDATDLTEILPTEWQPLFQGSLGEWKTYLLLTTGTKPGTIFGTEEAQQAAGGWNGDHTQIFRKLSGESILTAHWKFDSPADTQEFFELLSSYAAQRFAGETVEILTFPCLNTGSQISCLVLQSDDVFWLVAPDTQTSELILKNYTFLETE